MNYSLIATLSVKLHQTKTIRRCQYIFLTEREWKHTVPINVFCDNYFMFVRIAINPGQRWLHDQLSGNALRLTVVS